MDQIHRRLVNDATDAFIASIDCSKICDLASTFDPREPPPIILPPFPAHFRLVHSLQAGLPGAYHKVQDFFESYESTTSRLMRIYRTYILLDRVKLGFISSLPDGTHNIYHYPILPRYFSSVLWSLLLPSSSTAITVTEAAFLASIVFVPPATQILDRFMPVLSWVAGILTISRFLLLIW